MRFCTHNMLHARTTYRVRCPSEAGGELDNDRQDFDIHPARRATINHLFVHQTASSLLQLAVCSISLVPGHSKT